MQNVNTCQKMYNIPVFLVILMGVLAILSWQNGSDFRKIAVSLVNINQYRPSWSQNVGNVPGYVIRYERKQIEKISPFFCFS